MHAELSRRSEPTEVASARTRDTRCFNTSNRTTRLLYNTVCDHRLVHHRPACCLRAQRASAPPTGARGVRRGHVTSSGSHPTPAAATPEIANPTEPPSMAASVAGPERPTTLASCHKQAARTHRRKADRKCFGCRTHVWQVLSRESQACRPPGSGAVESSPAAIATLAHS